MTTNPEWVIEGPGSFFRDDDLSTRQMATTHYGSLKGRVCSSEMMT